MKLKTQTEILEYRDILYKTKYQEIDQDLMTEIRELCPTKTQQFLSALWENNCIREEGRYKKSFPKNYMAEKSCPKRIRKKLSKKNDEKRKQRKKMSLHIHTGKQNHRAITTQAIITHKEHHTKEESTTSKYHQTQINYSKHPKTAATQ